MIPDKRLDKLKEVLLLLSRESELAADGVKAIEELKELRKQNKELLAYADKLIEPLDYLPKDIENIRRANYRLHEVEQQNKALIDDAEKLAIYAKEMYSYLTEEDEEWDSDVEIALDQHEELMKQYE